jgi:hypothetical protein
MSGKLRLLAILAGCFSAIFGAPAFGAIFLILGAAIQPRAQAPGKWLMWLGALLLSTTVLGFGPGVVFEGIRAQLQSHDNIKQAVDDWLFLSTFLAATVLVLWCDVALMWDALRAKQDVEAAGLPRRSLEWVAWIVAVLLTVWSFRSDIHAVRAYRLHGFLDPLLTGVGISAAVLLFDVALIVHAFKARERRPA